MDFKLTLVIQLLVATLTNQFTSFPPDVKNHKNLQFLNHDLCGPINEFKAFGGTEVEIYDFPWMALLQYEVKDGNKTYLRFLCGGSIINNRYILTAAHCVKFHYKNALLKSVRLGEHNLNTNPDCDMNYYNKELICVEKYQEYEIEKIIPHPKYNSVLLGNDIALLKLNRDIDFTINIKPICLPIGRASNLLQKMVTASGWGLTEKMSFSANLLMVHLPIISNDECNVIYNKYLTKKIQINKKQMCAGGIKGRDACSRDSGGPLQSPAVYNKNVRFVQYGIVSYGYPQCGTEGIPGVYTKVSYFTNWILDNIDK